MKNYLAIVIITLAGLAMTPPAMALAVSDIELGSALNQKLNAKIYLLSPGAGELNNLRVNIRQVESAVQSDVVFEYSVAKEGGNPCINITTVDAVREPILNLEVELNWSGGHLIREYTLIFDPR